MGFEPGPTKDKRLQNVVSAGGNQLSVLETMLEMLAERLDAASPRDSASLSRQIQVLMDQIEEIKSRDGEEVDELSLFEQNFG